MAKRTRLAAQDEQLVFDLCLPPGTKLCRRCRSPKPVAEFRQRPGASGPLLESWCEDCRRAYQRERTKTPAGRAALNERMKRYYRTERGGVTVRRIASAQNKTKHLIVNGKVRPRPATCERCGASGRIEMHHLDYDRPDLIWWLCTSCHAIADEERRESA